MPAAVAPANTLPDPGAAELGRTTAARFRFALAWALPLGVGLALLHSPLAAFLFMSGTQVAVALLERVPAFGHSPAAAPHTSWHRACLWVHAALQLGLMAWALVWLVATPAGQAATVGAALALGHAVGGVAGSQGITFAHELGHSRRKADRALAWLLLASVNYAHFMVEHYRGHHVRAATHADPASARAGESLWCFLPRTLWGSWVSAWRLEQQQLRSFNRGWRRSPLLWATLGQLAWLVLLGTQFGSKAVLLWLSCSAYAVFLLEAVNYIEHYGLQRGTLANGRPEPFAVHHAWNADHLVTNSLIANLQRHSDHHLHAWRPYAELRPLPGPQLPTGYAGCLYLASVPPLWFALMRPRLAALR